MKLIKHHSHRHLLLHRLNSASIALIANTLYNTHIIAWHEQSCITWTLTSQHLEQRLLWLT